MSDIGPKTSWAVRDRPELNLELKFSRCNNLPEIVAGRRPHGFATNFATALATAGLHRATDCAASSRQRPISMREAAPSIRPPCTTSAHGIARPARSRAMVSAAACGGRQAKTNFVVQSEIRELDAIQATIVLKDPSLGSDTTVGEPWRIRITSPGSAAEYGPFNPYIPIRSTTIGKSRVVRDPIAMHTSWRSNSDIASVTRVSMKFRVVRTNQYNQDLGLFHSTNGNHLESPNEGSSIDHQVTIYLHAKNITMFPTNETWYFASQILVSSADTSLKLGRPYPHFDGPID
ncbi:P-loop containing nucleoside triphosphate hydrolases superfamily protein [Dorcoceras hygrometricum]|uniref:P-loop containing nucleoside triphosphate hydrolases superfamily protein n=1 Tax=Dorcoceras hygrometricum TaxID=472368 RepID=A0A2Z7A667_9LAMI|nr:P-loop containing nucleoside triphosphate hydrolases superfamily protein [Dorcoceras hygrometricum]